MKVVSENLGVARSQLTARLKQLPPGPQPRRRRTRNDAALVEQIKQAVGALNSYGYRRVWGLLRRQHERQALPPVNVKRMYCVMRDHDLLLERRRKQPGVARRNEGRVAVDTSIEQARAFARQIGLLPLTTPVCSPQSNGMAESFVKTMKRDYLRNMPKPDRATALRKLAIAFEHYNEEHPHSALNYRSP